MHSSRSTRRLTPTLVTLVVATALALAPTTAAQAEPSSSPSAKAKAHTARADPTLPFHLEPAYGNHQSAFVLGWFIGPLGVRVTDDRGQPVADLPVLFTVREFEPNRTRILFIAVSPAAVPGTTGPDGLAWTGVPYSMDSPGKAYVDVAPATGSGSGSTTFELLVKPKVAPAADLRLTLTAPARARTKHRVTVGLQLDNRGPSSADQVATVLTWPRGWSVVDAGAGTLSGRSITYAADPVDSDLPLRYQVTLKASNRRGPSKLRATTVANTPDPATQNNADRAKVTLR